MPPPRRRVAVLGEMCVYQHKDGGRRKRVNQRPIYRWNAIRAGLLLMYSLPGGLSQRKRPDNGLSGRGNFKPGTGYSVLLWQRIAVQSSVLMRLRLT
jgi:hypothetical protein